MDADRTVDDRSGRSVATLEGEEPMTLHEDHSSMHKSLHTLSRCRCGRCVLGEVLCTLTCAVLAVAGTGFVLMASRALGILFRGL